MEKLCEKDDDKGLDRDETSLKQDVLAPHEDDVVGSTKGTTDPEENNFDDHMCPYLFVHLKQNGEKPYIICFGGTPVFYD